MNRRAFLTGLTAASSAAADADVTLKSARPLHPRVQVAVHDLLDAIRRLPAPGASQQLNVEFTQGFAPEEWEVATGPDGIAVRGDDRGLAYALAWLRRTVTDKQAVPARLSLRRAPHFKVRRWSTAVSHAFGAPWDERIHLADRFAYIKADVIRRAADYGMNGIEINGRPADGWDIDWVISFKKYPDLARLFPPGERKRRLELVEDLARDAKRNLLEFMVWSHELHLPPGFTELYPQAAGTGYPVCLSNDLLTQFIGDKYVEFFTACPSVDGVVVSVNESGEFSLITDEGCRCERCSRLSQHGRLMAVLNPVIAVAARLNKQVVLRTFQSSWKRDLYSHPELETIRKAYAGLPSQAQIMSKYCPLDFYGTEIADEPLIGAFPNPHLVELSLDVEWQGRTFVPALTPDNFRRRIGHAVEKKCVGIVARVDFPFPSMEPGPIFGHPNEFNAWYVGELLWDPKTDLDDSLYRWTRQRYGEPAAPKLAPALKRTEWITQKTFFCLGQTLINYHNMIAGVSFSDEGLWSRALSKWDPSKRKLSETFFEPDDELIAAAAREKREALAAANQTLADVLAVKGALPELDFERLRAWSEKLRDSAELWGCLTDLYLRHRQLASSPAKPERVRLALSQADALNRLLLAARLALRQSLAMERVHGASSWPVSSPDRGITAYEFVHQALRSYIAAVTGEPARDAVKWRYANDVVVTEPVVEPGSLEYLWRRLVEAARPRVEIGSAERVKLRWPAKLQEVRVSGDSVTLIAADGGTLELPLPFPVRDVSLRRETTLMVRKHVHGLDVEPQPAA
ncbi:MAG: hypothetical protein KIT09_07500 [Bryobacteraceae bacterium]|nr:hypothetical protein [Bryobacteraceae bacterium]